MVYCFRMMRRFIPQPLKPVARMALKFLGAIRWAFFHPYYLVGTSEAVWFGFMNREGRMLFQKNHPSPNAVEARIASELTTRGIAVTHLDELFPGRSPLELLRAHAASALAPAKTGRKKSFLRYAWRDSADTILLDLSDPLIRLAIEPHVLEIINSYMAMWSKLDFYSLAATVLVPPGSEEQGSQRWHRDPGDKRIVKLFLYLTDVEEPGAGPFSYVPGSQEGGPWRHVYPPRPDDGYYPPPGAIERAIPEEAMRICYGPAGTLIFCDTTGLHRGGYSTTKERIMFTASYSAKRSLTHPIKYRFPEHFEKDISALVPHQRYAVDNR